MASRFSAPLIALAMTLTFSACGTTSTYRLPGHSARDHSSPVEIVNGEKRIAVAPGVFSGGRDYRLNIASEEPAIVDVLYKNDSVDSGRVYLVGRGPGIAIVHYGNLYDQVGPFAGSESVRIGAALPGNMVSSDFDLEKRREWLREHSDGEFKVIVR
jgi:hypothetical protein